MTRLSSFRQAARPFVIVCAACILLLVTDQVVHRPTEISAPASADSLAGVVARLFPGRADSAAIARVRWFQSPRKWLSWAAGDQYAYRGEKLPDRVVTAAEADLVRFSITFAAHQVTPFVVKHELGHLLLNQPGHPAAVFDSLERYYGR